MASSRPFTDAHAIACVDVAIFLESALTDEQRASVRDAMQEVLVAAGFEARKSSSTTTVAWRKINDEAEPLEEFHIHPGFFHFSAFEYRGWTYTREAILSRLAPVIQLLADRRLTPIGIGLAFIDVFFNDEPDNYQVTDVFAPHSPYLAQVIYESGHEWKNQVSWSEEVDHAQIESSLSISARLLTEEDDDDRDGDGDATGEGSDAMDSDQHITEIQNKLSVMEDPSQAAVSWSKEEVASRLDLLHSKNKQLLLDLLSEDMIRRIGLKE